MIKVRPISKWPWKKTNYWMKEDGRFRLKPDRIRRELFDELERVDATDTVVEADFRERDIRIHDGYPKANAKPASSAVIVNFKSKGEHYRFACDKYRWWVDNIRAITLTLAALRAVERYGSVRDMEQYAGFRAIAEPSPESPFDVIAELSGQPVGVVRATRGSCHFAYKAAVKVHHPDVGGKTETFQRLTEAWRKADEVFDAQ